MMYYKKKKKYDVDFINSIAMGSVGLGASSIAVGAVGQDTTFLSNTSRSLPAVGTIMGASILRNSIHNLAPKKKKRKSNR